MQLTDSLKTRAGKSKPSSSSLMVQPSGETANTSIRQGETALKSLWFQRFKLRDEAEEDSLYPSDQAGQKKGVEEGCASIREGHVGAFQQEKTSKKPDVCCGDQPKWNSEKSSVPDSSRPILNKQKDYAVDLQNQGFTEGKEAVARHLAGGAPAVPLKSGFGPWIKAKAGIRLEEKSQVEPERTGPTLQRVFHGPGTSNFPSPLGSSQTCKQAGEREQGATGGTSRLTSSVWRPGSGNTPTEEIAHASLGKPPLPPLPPGARGRPKFTSRPISLKTQGLPFLPGRLSSSACVQGIPVPERVIPDSQLAAPPVQMSISRDGVTTRKVVAIDEARLTRVIEETGSRGGVSLEDASPSKLSCSELDSVPKEHAVNFVDTGPHRTVLSASHTENNGLISAHMVSFGKVVPAIEISQSMVYNQSTRRKSTMVHPPPIFPQNKGEPSEGSGAIIENAADATGVETAVLPSTPVVTDFPLELPVHSIKESKMVKGGEVLQSDVDEPNGNALQPTPLQRGGSFDGLETSHGAARSDKAEGASEPAHSASSTASYPWGLFMGAAGTSRKAREQFVEVYNRARDDLKNQRTSLIVSRVPEKVTDDCARLASGKMANAGDVPNCTLEKQALESQKEPVGNLHGQESFEALNGELEPTNEHACQNGKALKLCLPEKEQPRHGRQVCSIAEGNVWRSQEKGSQTFQAIHGADGSAAPRVENGQHGNSPAAPAIGFAFNASSGSHRETVILSKHNEGLKENELQFRVDQKIPQERLVHQNKDCQRKFERRSDAVAHVTCQVPGPEGTMHFQDQGFLRKPDLVHNQKVDSKFEEYSLSKGLVRLASVSNNGGDKKDGASLLLGKRPRGVFPEAAISGINTGVTGKVYIDGTERPRAEMPSNRPRVWLQRWQSTPHICDGMQGHTHGQFKGAGQHAYDDFALGQFKFNDINNNNLVGQATELRSFAQTVQKEQEVKFFQMESAKVLPSPAAMAIVGTATRQFCSAQLQRKGCLSFW